MRNVILLLVLLAVLGPSACGPAAASTVRGGPSAPGVRTEASGTGDRRRPSTGPSVAATGGARTTGSGGSSSGNGDPRSRSANTSTMRGAPAAGGRTPWTSGSPSTGGDALSASARTPSASGGNAPAGGSPTASGSPSTSGNALSASGRTPLASDSNASASAIRPSTSGATASSAIAALSPAPRVAIDYEYASVNGAWNSGFALAAPCATQSAYGAWDARNGYGGLVLDLGNPLGLAVHAGSLALAESTLKTAETCFAQGFAGIAPHAQPVIYIGFSNCIPVTGSTGSCGTGSASTAQFTRAGTTAAAYVETGASDVEGGWGDFESDWSTVGAVHAEMAAYMAANRAQNGRSQWCDSTYRNYQAGLPNSSWTFSAMVSLYVAPIVQAGYTCLGTQRILIPQAYLASWLTDGAGNFSPSSSLATYVGGITVCGAVASAGRCPDLGIPAGASKWTAYTGDGYVSARSSVVAVVAASLLGISLR